MHLTFYGAAHEVTGSCHLLDTGQTRVLFDCGMFQGTDFNEARNFDPFGFDPKTIDAVLVSHAHLDHVGRIPKLLREGFKGKIWMTKGTRELARLVWEDAHNVMAADHEKFQSPILFTPGDIAEAYIRSTGIEYEFPIQIAPDITAIWHDVGHILGSAFIEVRALGKTIVFSGDVGNDHVPILKDTSRLPAADILLIESTYGDREHETEGTRRDMLLKLLTEGVQKGGTIMIPSFSIERTQELLYEMHTLSEHDHRLPKVPIFLDSPLAINATNVFKQYPQYYDKEAASAYMLHDDFLSFPTLHIAYTQDESKAINMVKGAKIVIAGAGMMNGGRILHHARRYVSDPRSTLIIVGYQATGTLGRRLYEGAQHVTIFGEEIPVRCRVKAIGALSAHADQHKLLAWIREAKGLPKTVYCIHGEPHAATELAHRIRERFSINAFVPEYGETVEM